MRNTVPNLYIIEARTPDGALDFTDPQPESVFGDKAITGITDWDMAQAIYRQSPDAVLQGDQIALWPRWLDPRWTARPKTW